jgi:LmbE family N-acetylglucosaminyl deacetylase
MGRILLLFIVNYCSLSAVCQLPKVYSSSEIFQQIKKLNVLGSVLYIGAHPDDENNSLLPYMANEKLYRTGYLSLTRGDGGQNLIGDEQGIELGLIRTQELLAARKVDGAEQFFTRAYEFGFSRSAEEALHVWDKDKILSDVVWVVRQFQPDIIITRFPADRRAGHGHHSASSILANEAFTAAADTNRFPEQFKYGVKPWQAKRILWNSYNFGNNNTTSEDQMKIDIGMYNPLLGKSYGELGGEARTLHKSQGEGRPRRRGQLFEYFATTGGSAPKNDLMEGITIDWNRINGGAKIQSLINEITDGYRIDKPEMSVAGLVKLYTAIEALTEGNWRNKKLQEVQQLIEECSALFSEATSEQQSVIQGDTLRTTFFINNRSAVDASLKAIELEGFDTSLSIQLTPNENFSFTKTVNLPANKKISQPYWLVYPQLNGTFDVRDQMLIGKAENDPAFLAKFVVNIQGRDFTITRPVQYKFNDALRGDVYQPIPVLPKVELNYVKDNFISLNGNPVQADFYIKSNNPADSSLYRIIQQYSKKWGNNNPQTTYKAHDAIVKYGTAIFTPLYKEINTTEEINLKTSDGKYDGYTKTISYEHIPTITYFPKAKANLVKLDIKVIGKNIGYIAGAGDKVFQALESMGYNMKMLTEADINDEYLKQFDAIITGVRAYNIHEFLSNKNDVLMRYVQNGGNLIVQYLKSNQVGTKTVEVGPYPFAVSSRNRVTEENAKVNFLLPDHPALNSPNKITAKDFEGWVQERSTYQADQADEHYEKLLGMNDSGEKESNGSLIIAKYGKGNFVYTGLVFFRELPAGIPGAFRIMANLIGLPKNK